MNFLRQGTSASARIGKFVDDTDGKTPEPGLTIANTDIQISKNGASSVDKNSGGATADGTDGWYTATFDATDTSAVGTLRATVDVAGALSVWEDFQVLSQAAYDSLFVTGSVTLATAAALVIVDTEVGEIQTDLDNGTDGLGAIKTVVDSRMAEASINTTAGAVDTVTSNTDMRGTNSANTVAPDNAGISSNGSAIAALNDFDPDNNDVAVVTLVNSIAGTLNTLDDLDTEQDAQHTITQGLVSSIAASPGVGAVPFVPNSITVVAGVGASGDADDMANDDEDLYSVDDSAGTLTLDLNYEVGSGATSIQFILIAASQGVSDDLTLQFYDQIDAEWDPIDTIDGLNTLTYETFDKVLVGKYTTNTGLFKVRITGTGLNAATLTINKAVAYGVAKSGGITNGSTVTLSEATTNQNLIGHNWTLALGGQDIGGSYIFGSKHVSGIATCVNGSGYVFEDCVMESPVLSTEGQLKACSFEAISFTSTAGAIADEIMISLGKSKVAGADSPILTWAGVTKETSVNIRGWLGGGDWTFTSDVTASIEVFHGGKHTINTGGGNVEFRGFPREIVIALTGGETVQVIANTGPISISGDGTGSTVKIYGSNAGVTNTASGSPAVTLDGLPTNNTATGTEVQDIQDRLPAALVSGRMNSNLSAIGDDADSATNLAASTRAIEVTTVDSSSSTTVFTLTAGSSVNDTYVGSMIAIPSTSANHSGEKRAVESYDGSSKEVTVATAFTTQLTAGDVVVIL